MFDKIKAKGWDTDVRIKMINDFANIAKTKIENIDNKTILDFGTGTGLLLLNFKNAKSLIGIDNSNDMLNILKEKIDLENIKNISLYNSLEEVKENYDIVVSSMAFHHIEDIDNLIKNLKSKLNKNGQIFIFDLCKEDGSFHKNNIGIYHFGFDKKYLKDILIKNEFKNIQFEVVYEIERNSKIYEIFLLNAQI
ncbi:MAG: hypothetical protein PWP46_2166 [Fusobacteriaceae bacterium]|jgi:2-polyprenyl-3-methyl-5-hydroxy-6-metoxy-1,4-benzoquinol methylase|nr:hypothetical protein [Fusobacteriaceae bacterium]